MDMNMLEGIAKQTYDFALMRPYVKQLIITVTENYSGKMACSAVVYGRDGSETSIGLQARQQEKAI